MEKAIELLAKERQRQITEKGFTPEKDDTYYEQELQTAAGAFLRANDYYQGDGAIELWPWEENTFKPSEDPIRNLVKAGALIVAEIERLQRKNMK